MIDRGFEAMIPQAASKKQEEQEDLFRYDIRLPLFGRIFSVTDKVQKQE